MGDIQWKYVDEVDKRTKQSGELISEHNLFRSDLSVTNSSGVLGILRPFRKKTHTQVAQDLRTRFSSVRAQGHWLILGWGDKTLLLIDELLLGLAELRSETHDTFEGLVT